MKEGRGEEKIEYEALGENDEAAESEPKKTKRKRLSFLKLRN